MKNKGVDSKVTNSDKLSPEQREIYIMLTDEYLTQKQIALRRGTSPQAVSKIVKKLKEKGILKKGLTRGCLNTPPVSMKGFKDNKIVIKEWRYHGLHFVIKPYYFYPRYHKIRTEKGNYSIPHREWTIKLHPDMVEIQLKRKEDFHNPDKWASTRLAEESFNRTLNELENRYGFCTFKEGKANICKVNGHLARNPSEIADARDGEYLRARGKDGKVWFTIDKSDGAEHEYQHPDRHLSDSEKIEPYLNDMLYNQPATLSQMMKLVKNHLEANKETTENLKELSAGMNTFIMLMTGKKSQEEIQEKKDKELTNYFG